MISARQAARDDIPTVADLWLEAAAWLRDRGLDQWQYPIKMHNIESAVDGGYCWLFEEDDEPIATVTLDDRADPNLWRPEDRPNDALYLHRLVVRRRVAARHLGTAIIDWASLRARAAGRSYLRLDAWNSNIALHRYYLDLGFELVRTVTGAQVLSGVLFQRPAGQVRGRGPAIATDE